MSTRRDRVSGMAPAANFGHLCLALVCVCILSSTREAAGVTLKPPTIIVVLADDLGYGDLGCYGGDFATPHLDRMAREGIRFTQAYAAAPICSPSRCGMLTGQFPGRWRITSFLQTRKGNRACEQDDFLDPSAPSLPRLLKARGYRTAHVGKWHLGGGRDVTNAPNFAAYGYDAGFGTYESPEPHPDITATNWIWSPHDKVKRWDRTAWMVDRTLDFVREKTGTPAFVNLWLDDPHTPWIPSADAIGSGRRNERLENLRAVLTEMDKQIGRLLTELREAALTNTFVIFVSDNGPLPTFRQARSGTLRGSKLSLYEGGIRVPMIAWWPGRIRPGIVDESTVFSGLDFLPSLGRIAGMEGGLPEGDGEDLSRALLGEHVARRKPLFWEYGRNTNSFAFNADPHHRSPNVAMREAHWKFLINADGSRTELYDLNTDRNETNNLATAKPGVAKRLADRALAWRKSLPSSSD